MQAIYKRCGISSPALSIILNGELVFVAFVMRYPRALVYGQFPFFDRSDCESQRIFLSGLVRFCQQSIQVAGETVRALSKNCI